MLSKRAIFYKGISTIELIVTIAIFVLITTSILVSYPQLSSQLALEKTTQDVSSTLHETRMYGIGVKSFGAMGAGSIRTSGYGVHFAKGNTNSYVLFSDVNNNHKYDSSPTEEKSSEFKINGSETISDVCVINAQDTSLDTMCSSSGNCLSSDLKTVDVLFSRPAPSVFINGFKDDSYESTVCPGTGGDETCGRAIIVIKSPRGNCKKIEAWTTGQVNIQAKLAP